MLMADTISTEHRHETAGLVKRVWLLLYAEGGRWTEAEIRKRLHLPVEIHTALREMAERGFVDRKRICNIDNECSVQYGVIRACKVPRGVTVEEMWEVLQIGRQA
jgi:Uncharacterized membrane-associated protein/domain